MLLSPVRVSVKKQMGVPRRINRSLFACLFFLLILSGSSVCTAQNQDLDKFYRAAKFLADKICSAVGDHASIFLEVKNISTLSAADVAIARSSFEGELLKRGARLTPAQPADAEVRITLSENLQDFLWVAEIRHGEARDTAMISVPRAKLGAHPEAPPELTIQKEFILQQQAPILDIAVISIESMGGVSRERVLRLDPSQVAIDDVYGTNQEGKTQSQEAAVPFAHSEPWPRDLRGLLQPNGGQFKAFLPGIECIVGVQPALTLSCQPSANPWPLSMSQDSPAMAPFAPRRNYFEGLTFPSAQGNKMTTPFYSRAYQPGGAAAGIFAELNGETRIVHGDQGSSTTIPGLGSDILMLQSDCGSGWQLLVTKPGDWTVSDSVQAYQVTNSQPIPVGRAVDFEGPVTALWPSVSDKMAYAIVHNLKSGLYEAYRLSIACSR